MWSGRYADSMIGDDMRDYRDWRRKAGVAESTINREQTAIITLFNKLAEWRRSGQLSRTVLLPEENPGKGVKKVNEDRFIRGRLLTDEEYQNLWACADHRLRRIILAEMNLPLRLADLKRLNKKNINHRLSRFQGVQAKTDNDYALPINGPMWELIRTAPGDDVLDFSGFEGRWKRAVKRAGLQAKSDRPLQFRDLRRTAATTLHDSGESLKTISAMLGHRAVSTTIRYLGLKEENLKRAGEVLAAKYRAPTEIGKSQLQSVPESVPTISKNASDEFPSLSEFDRFRRQHPPRLTVPNRSSQLQSVPKVYQRFLPRFRRVTRVNCGGRNLTLVNSLAPEVLSFVVRRLATLKRPYLRYNPRAA
jgi:integrase